MNNLKKGLANYGQLKDKEDVPEGLSGEEKQKLLIGNISEILQLHEQEILPLMLRNQRDLKGLFDEFAVHFEVSRGKGEGEGEEAAWVGPISQTRVT